MEYGTARENAKRGVHDPRAFHVDPDDGNPGYRLYTLDQNETAPCLWKLRLLSLFLDPTAGCFSTSIKTDISSSSTLMAMWRLLQLGKPTGMSIWDGMELVFA